MLLGVRPLNFLLRLLVLFFLTYFAWRPIEPVYTEFMATLTRSFLHATEGSPPVTVMQVRETKDGRPAIFYRHRQFPMVQSGIPAEWVQANMVLLIPLMLATPAPSIRARLGRFGLALGIAVILQVLDISVTVKSLYASNLPGYGGTARWLYQFGDAFVQAMDTQLFPFAIWAGIHFRQLVGGVLQATAPRAAGPVRAERRRAQRSGGGRRR
jgi:hypothetical protein